MDWKFDDPPNCASLTTKYVLDGDPIMRVYHDWEGGWQFHGPSNQIAIRAVARCVCLGDMVARDASIMSLHDLPFGWCATRTSTTQPWNRSKHHPFATFAENGYYLDNAVWLADFLDDVNPPSESIRETLKPGQFAKLIFRFRPEDSERHDHECERMWVRITEIDENENYIGVLENEPFERRPIDLGDTVHFHPDHVMDCRPPEGA